MTRPAAEIETPLLELERAQATKFIPCVVCGHTRCMNPACSDVFLYSDWMGFDVEIFSMFLIETKEEVN